jgi:hypothetical protein
MSNVARPDPAIADVLAAFLRLESVVALYPDGHHRTVQAAQALLDALSIVRPSPIAPVRLVRTTLGFVAGMRENGELDSTGKQVAEVFDALGIEALEFDANTSIGDLCSVSRRVRKLVLESRSAALLEERELSLSFGTVRALERGFGARAARKEVLVARAAKVRSTVDAAQGRVDAAELPGEEQQLCKRWIERVVENAAETVPIAESLAPENSDGPRRTLDEVLGLAGHALECALERFLSAEREGYGLPALFEAIEQAATASDDPETARQLVGLLQDSAREVAEDEAVAKEARRDGFVEQRDEYEMSLDELRMCLAERAAVAQPFKSLVESDRAESMALLFDVAQVGSGAAADLALERLVAEVKTGLCHGEPAAVTAGVRAWCQRLAPERLDRWLDKLAAAIGEARADVWLLGLIQAGASGQAALENAWPHLANELLLGPRPGTRALAGELAPLVARLGGAQLAAGMRRLQRMSALCESRVSRHAFEPARDDLMRFYQALLGHNHGLEVQDALFAGIVARRPGWRGAEIFRVVASTDPGASELLARLLEGQGILRPTRAAQQVAARMLAERLGSLEFKRRGDAWVIEALRSLAELRPAEAKALFTRVRCERRWTLAPAWPRSCREVAEIALAAFRSETAS